MTKLPRTLRLDASDALVFEAAAAPGEWAVPGGFAFNDPETLSGKRRQAFRAGFLGLASFGWSTLVEVVEAGREDRAAAVAALAAHLRDAHGAPDAAVALAAAEDEIGFAESLCDHPPGTVLALARSLEDGTVRERFRTLHRRDPTRLPVFALVEEVRFPHPHAGDGRGGGGMHAPADPSLPDPPPRAGEGTVP